MTLISKNQAFFSWDHVAFFIIIPLHFFVYNNNLDKRASTYKSFII